MKLKRYTLESMSLFFYECTSLQIRLNAASESLAV